MNTATATDTHAPPVAIGGVGGSGTRVVAMLLREMGVHLGSDRNETEDSVAFTLLFKRLDILERNDAEFDLLTDALVSALQGGRPPSPAMIELVDACARIPRAQHSAVWLAERASALLAAAGRPAHGGRWGWKEPNTHVVIDRLWRRVPDLRYIHVVRNGVTMAQSTNQNQLRLWGPRTLGSDGAETPARSLAYWCRVHQQMQALQARHPGRMYWLHFDALCLDPQPLFDTLCQFLDVDPEPHRGLLARVLPAEPAPPPLATWDMVPADIAYVRSLGYPVNYASAGAAMSATAHDIF